jgi:ABC-2 type transport system permease protein
MMMMQQPPPPKGDIGKLWQLLGVSFPADAIIWQNYNPYPKASQFPKEFVFIDAGCGADEPFNRKSPITSGLQQVLFPFPGSITKLNTAALQITPLVETGIQTGTVRFGDLMRMTPFGPSGGLNPQRRLVPTSDVYLLAAQVKGEVDAPAAKDAKDTKAKEAKKDEKPAKANLNVVLVADVDMLSPGFFMLREQGDIPEADIHFNFDNVTFVLNVLDGLAGSDEFLDIRKRRRVHRTLTAVEKQTEEARKETAKVREQITADFDQAQKDEQKRLDDQIAGLQKGWEAEQLDQQEILRRVQIVLTNGQKRMNATVERLQQERDQKINRIDTDLAIQVRHVQFFYKMCAVLIPPIAPLVLAVVVFLTRRSREREGVSRSRLRS